jgi:DNA cross-link repair 1A protein
MLTTDPHGASVHIVPLRFITRDRLKVYADRFKSKFSHVVGFRPTGWTSVSQYRFFLSNESDRSAPTRYIPRKGFNQNPSVASVVSQTQQQNFTYASLRPALGSTPALQWFGVPYSEHSSFFELTCFALSLNWGKMIATVNVGSELSRAKMARWVEKWKEEKRKRTNVGVVPARSKDYW